MNRHGHDAPAGMRASPGGACDRLLSCLLLQLLLLCGLPPPKNFLCPAATQVGAPLAGSGVEKFLQHLALRGFIFKRLQDHLQLQCRQIGQAHICCTKTAAPLGRLKANCFSSQLHMRHAFVATNTSAFIRSAYHPSPVPCRSL